MAEQRPQPDERINRMRVGLSRTPGVQLMRIDTQSATSRHDHLFHEIVYVERGSGEHVTVDGTRRLRPGDLIVMRPQMWHGYENPSQLCIINCLIDNRVVQRFAPVLDHVDGSFELFRRRSPRAHLEPPVLLHADTAQRQVILNRLETMLDEQASRRSGWQAAVTAGALEMLVLTARLLTPSRDHAAAPLPDRTDQAVLDAVSHIEQNFDQPIVLADLARRVHLSAGHLSRSFNRRMGMGVIDFMHCMRAEEACRMLQTTQMSIAQIATAVGYHEIAYFSRCFRKQVGMSAREYRRTRQRIVTQDRTVRAAETVGAS